MVGGIFSTLEPLSFLGMAVFAVRLAVKNQVSTRLLIYAGSLIRSGIGPGIACRAALCNPISDDSDVLRAVEKLIDSVF